jgi:4-amino-4-deoxy-L-arabinose transferase-like glycosyltransferase
MPPAPPRLRDLAILLAVCALVFWLRLGQSGLAGSEGFRVLPAWAMLDNGDYIVPHLYTQAYLRKPPGMMWAIAGASALLGRTEFAARAVSALAMTLAAILVLILGDRWFGRPKGLCAGLAFLLTPLLWAPGRTAEIEALHTALVLCASVALIDMGVNAERATVGRRLGWAAWAGLSLSGAMLVKGPAGVPTLAGVLTGICLVRRSLAALYRWELLLAAGISTLVFGAWLALASRRVEELGVTPIVEEARFLWRAGKEAGVLLLLPTALASALPWALALPMVLLPDESEEQPARVARTVGWSVVLGLVVMTLLGIDNVRYAMPTIALIPFAYAGALYRHSASSGRLRQAGEFLLLGRPVIPLAGLLLVAVGYTQWQEHWRSVRHSGRSAGVALAQALPEMRVVVADELLDTRPEIFYYAQQEYRARGRDLTVIWQPGLAKHPSTATPGAYIAIRNDLLQRDFGAPEWLVLQASMEESTPEPVYRGEVHKFSFAVFAPSLARER